jgi:HSP20 family protein
VDVKRAPYGWLVKAELPGVALDQVQISIRGNSLLLSGVRRDTLPAEGDTYYAMEIAYCRFERRIDFPVPIEGAEVTLASHNGLLLVRLVLSSEPSAPADQVLRP